MIRAAVCLLRGFFFFFFNDTATTEIYTLSLHDALPISLAASGILDLVAGWLAQKENYQWLDFGNRSEEHTSELQSLTNLVCRLLLEKKKKDQNNTIFDTAQCTKDGRKGRGPYQKWRSPC